MILREVWALSSVSMVKKSKSNQRCRMLDVEELQQKSGYDCGPTCIRAILRYYSVDVPVGSILCTPQDGTDPRTAEAMFRSLGFGVQSGEMTLADLAHHVGQRRPVMCPIQMHGEGHWVVVVSVADGSVGYLDPLTGFESMSADEWDECWIDHDRLPAVWDRWGLVAYRV